MTSVIQRLLAKGTGHKIEYKDELVHNVVALTQNAIMSVASKVKDNVLLVMTTLVIVLQNTMPSNPVANPPHALLKAPNALVIRQVCIASGKLEATKLWRELAEAWAQQHHQPRLPIIATLW